MRKALGIALALALLAGALWLGGWAGWRVNDAAERLGCERLPADVVPAAVQPAAPDHVRFAALGDTGTGNAGAHRVAAALRTVCAEAGCDFVAFLGDNVYPDGVSGPDDPLFDSAFESVYAGLTVPVLPVLGNHDVHQPALYEVLHSRDSALWRMPNTEYTFRAGPARFFAINTNCTPLTWWRLEDELGVAAPGWTFVLGHHSLYSAGPHGDANALTRWLWGGAQARVDFYLSGHNHLLEHLQREGERTDYVVSGSGGAQPVEPGTSAGPSAAALRFQHYGPGFAWFDVTPTRVTVHFYDADGTLLYAYDRTRVTR